MPWASLRHSGPCIWNDSCTRPNDLGRRSECNVHFMIKVSMSNSDMLCSLEALFFAPTVQLTVWIDTP